MAKQVDQQLLGQQAGEREKGRTIIVRRSCNTRIRCRHYNAGAFETG